MGTFGDTDLAVEKLSLKIVKLQRIRRLISMTETLKRSQTQKRPPSEGPRPLTKQEIESLRRDRQEGHQWAQKALDKMNIKPL